MLSTPTRAANKKRIAAFSLLECMVATAVSLIGLGSLMTLNSHQFRVLQSSHETNAGTLCLQERVEALRIATWRQLTDPNYLTTTLLAAPPKSAEPLAALAEQIT